MAIDSTNSSSNSLISRLNGPPTANQKKNEEIGKDAFLKILVTQLQNQDPENPQDSREFATQLAQFTQVEQLISINEKLTQQNNDVGGVAGYLGQQVVLDGNSVTVSGGSGGLLQVDLERAASNVMLRFVNSSGEVVAEQSLGASKAGKQTVSLENAGVPDGTYGIEVSALSTIGSNFTPNVRVSGIVTGFVPGPEPKLIVNGQEIDVADVREVTLPPQLPAAN